MQFGSLHQRAHELRVDTWIGADGNPLAVPLRLADLGGRYKVIYCFQHWCPGCHSGGFPTLKYLHDNLDAKDFGFGVIQTVFEGSDVNTADKLRVNQQKYDLHIPFGHDPAPKGEAYPTFMADYRSGGTPWFTLIDPAGDVVYADFQMDPARFISALEARAPDLKWA